MKKKYNQPKTKAIAIKSTRIMAVSVSEMNYRNAPGTKSLEENIGND